MDFALFGSEGFLFLLRWLHFLFGVIWIGHLYYFNFTQGPFFNETDAATKSSAIQKLVPRALWWFRWGAMWTVVTGWIYLMTKGHQGGFEIFGTSWGVSILLGALMGTIMWFNVWFVIWPSQKVVIANATNTAQGKPADPAAAARGARAALASRTNVLFSIPMLFLMGAASHLPIPVMPESNLQLLWGVLFAIVALIELNALKGSKMGPMTTVKGVITSGCVLTGVLYLIIEIIA